MTAFLSGIGGASSSRHDSMNVPSGTDAHDWQMAAEQCLLLAV